MIRVFANPGMLLYYCLRCGPTESRNACCFLVTVIETSPRFGTKSWENARARLLLNRLMQLKLAPKGEMSGWRVKHAVRVNCFYHPMDGCAVPWGNSQENIFIACDESVHLWWLERDISHSHLIVATALFSGLKMIAAEREIPILVAVLLTQTCRASRLLLI